MTDTDPFEMLDAIDEPVAPETRTATDDGEKKRRKHERHHLGIIQGDVLNGDFQVKVDPARYGLGRFHAALIAGQTKADIIAETESDIRVLFPMEPSSKAKMATHRYIRMRAPVRAAVKMGHTEESLLRLILSTPGPNWESEPVEIVEG